MITIAVPLMALAVVWSFPPAVSEQSRSAMLLEFRLNSATLADEPSVNDYMMGSLELPQSAVIDAMCMNGDLWFRDYTLDPTILVGNSSRLYRVAEVVDDGFDPTIAGAIEGSSRRRKTLL